MEQFSQVEVIGGASDIKKHRSYLNRLFLAFFGAWLLGEILLTFVSVGVSFMLPALSVNVWYKAVISSLFTPVVIGIFMIFMIFVKPEKHPVTGTINVKKAFGYFLMGIAIMIAGSLTGNILNALIGAIIGKTPDNSIEEMIDTLDYATVIFATVICAPIFEELLFRKILIDRIAKFGTFFSVVVSGVLFGIFHGNFYQFFYAAGLGALFAYIYCVYGKLRYTIIFHAVINFLGAIIPMLLEDGGEIGEIISVIHSLGYIVMAVFGVILLIKGRRLAKTFSVSGVLEKPFRAMCNAGFFILLTYAVIIFVISILA